MDRKSKFRIGVMAVLVAVLLGLYTARLFKLQEPAAAGELPDIQSYTFRTTVQAARGNILDANGNILVGNRASYNLQIINYVLLSSDGPNRRLLELAALCDSLGAEYADHLPLSRERPYAYTLDELDSNWQRYFKLFMAEYAWDTDMSPQNLMRALKTSFGIPEDWSEEDARRVVGLRYELALRDVTGTGLENYLLLTDVSTETMAAIMELAIPGLTVQTTTVREYNTQYAAHLLGHVGPMNPEEYQDIYKAQGYPMNARVGKEGLELAFEEYLHGVDGSKLTTVSRDGEILREYWEVEPQAGNNVVLTIDLDLQKTAENALENIILDLRENGLPSASSDSQGKGTDAEGGALVAVEIATGKVLACASYPTFNLATYNQDYSVLSIDPYRPYYNRALAPYPPGSTYKMVTAIAAIDYGGFGRHYEIEDQGKYVHFEDYEPECLIYTNTKGTHGFINMMEALEVSCNYYFYEVGLNTGITAIDTVAKNLGLGDPAGAELSEYYGFHRANAESKAEVYKDTPDEAGWWNADILPAAIGQSENRFTPLQLACYTAALANGGPRYRPTFLNRIVSANYDDLIVQNQPERISDYRFSDNAKACVQEGMLLVTTGERGTATNYFKDYNMAVCGKTGTAEHGAVGSANGAFVCYAPAEDPKIAIAVYVEKAAQGGNLSRAAMAVMDEYFQDVQSDELPAENVPS